MRDREEGKDLNTYTHTHMHTHIRTHIRTYVRTYINCVSVYVVDT